MKKLPRINRICPICKLKFEVRLTSNKIFCSSFCFYKSKIDKDPWNKGMSGEVYKKHYKNGFKNIFKKGNIPWTYGKKRIHLSPKTEFKYKNGSGSNIVLHKWVKDNLGQPNKCDFCGTQEKRMYHWANKSHEYKKELSDWYRLCVPCHRHYDKSYIKAWETRRLKNKQI